MKELLRTTDPVLISAVEALLGGEGIRVMVFDGNMSILEGSLGVLPRRIMVEDASLAAARKLLHDARINIDE